MKRQELKQELKQLAIHIREDKDFYKDCQRGKAKYEEYLEWKKTTFGSPYIDLSRRYRYRHVAYCMLRGRSYDIIESKVKPGNEIVWSNVEAIMKDYREVISA